MEIKINGKVFHVVLEQDVSIENEAYCRCGSSDYIISDSSSLVNSKEKVSSELECSEMGDIDKLFIMAKGRTM